MRQKITRAMASLYLRYLIRLDWTTSR